MAVTYHHPSMRAMPRFLGKDERANPERAEPSAPWSDILDKHDDRLIRDVGLTREEILGPEETFRREWRRRKAPWAL